MSLALDQLRRTRTRQEVALRVVRMAHADVAVGVDHVLLGEDAVGDHEVLDERVEIDRRSEVKCWYYRRASFR